MHKGRFEHPTSSTGDKGAVERFLISSEFLLRNEFLCRKYEKIDSVKKIFLFLIKICNIKQDYARLAKILANLLRIKSLGSQAALVNSRKIFHLTEGNLDK